MKLRSKMLTVFGVAIAVNLVAIWFGMTYVLDQVSTKLMNNQAHSFATYLQHQLIKEWQEHPDRSLATQADSQFDLARHIGDEGKDFAIRKILLVLPNLDIESSWPHEETGKSYVGHLDLQQAFINHQDTVVTETMVGPAGVETDIDVVSWFELPGLSGAAAQPRVLEVKLDFAGTMHLLEAQYQFIEVSAIVLASLLLITLMVTLLTIISRTAIRPVGRVSTALESVAGGNLDILLPEHSKDEFGQLARRFNEMIIGLKEKLQLSRYVSKGTMQAVKQAVSQGEEDQSHAGRRGELAVFFSDVRGFTSYSENRPPEQVIATLNAILSLQAEIIPRFGGDIDKFVGDEVMAVFETPLAAIHAAIAIQQALATRRVSVDHLHIGIGIHFGTVVQGDVGSPTQKDFTVIGDTVNTAARLQAVSKADEILISEAASLDLGHQTDFNLIPHGLLSLKGKDLKLKSYRVVADDPPPTALY